MTQKQAQRPEPQTARGDTFEAAMVDIAKFLLRRRAARLTQEQQAQRTDSGSPQA